MPRSISASVSACAKKSSGFATATSRVGDDVAVDPGDAGRLERGGPFVEQGGGPLIARVDRGVAAAAYDEIAFEHAAFDLVVGLDRRREAVVPAKRLCGGRQRHDLHV